MDKTKTADEKPLQKAPIETKLSVSLGSFFKLPPQLCPNCGSQVSAGVKCLCEKAK